MGRLAKGAICPGTGTRSGGHPGDQDTCPVCEEWVVVNADETLRKHTILARAVEIAERNQERQRRMWGDPR